jgi:hypothetical protein
MITASEYTGEKERGFSSPDEREFRITTQTLSSEGIFEAEYQILFLFRFAIDM